LKRSGKLSLLKGLVIGGLSEMKDNTIPFGKTAEEIIMDAVKEYKYPVCFGFPAGHGDKNYPLYLGREAALSVKEKTSLRFL
jgi:muramoyltetrapeptide carboxypeptidase